MNIFTSLLMLLFGYILCLLVLNYFMDKCSNTLTYSDSGLYLRSGGEYSNLFFRFVHSFIEKFIFIRFDSYKNNPRGNFIWLIAFIRISLFYTFTIIVYYFLSDQDNPLVNLVNKQNCYYFFIFVGTYFASISTLYYNKKKIFQEKWEYLANLYNKTLDYIGKEQYNLLENTLAIDIVTCMMWGHRSFSSIVNAQLRLSINAMDNKDHVDEFIKKLDDKKLTEKEALNILEDHQLILLKKLKSKGI